ncbi:MAG: hypothetical protein ACFCUP_03830 [Actinomycetales bacterium]
MAYGGMRGIGVPLGDRAIARSGTVPLPPRQPPTGREGRADPPLHCWVSHPADPVTDRSPGVLVEWRHRDDRWWGLVVFVIEDGGHPAVVTRLLPAEVLSPA